MLRDIFRYCSELVRFCQPFLNFLLGFIYLLKNLGARAGLLTVPSVARWDTGHNPELLRSYGFMN